MKAYLYRVFLWFANLFSSEPSVVNEDKRELDAPSDMRRLTLGIIVGHTKSAGGAGLHGTSMNEYQYNSQVAELMKAECERLGTIIPKIIFRDGIGISGAYKLAEKAQCDCVVELHFNAFNGSVEGTETLCTMSSDDKEFAGMVHRGICRAFGRVGNSRGVKPLSRSARGGGNIYAFPNGANCLVEPFFGDNASDAQKARSLQGTYSKALVEQINLWGMQKGLLD